ncbi:long-chain fatty acid--CoA ligase [Alteribacillus sp. JSM 102045]|uniref:long-chain-fatty-acid--CoA ligase n=1 Tax=Alteribacillus sp. JSM 102045 TaxID=1562101 RepID=UPI0035C20D61
MKRWHTFYPENIPKKVDIPCMHVYQMLEISAGEYPGETAVIDRETEWTYGELKDKVDRLAAALYENGLKKGDRAVLMFLNSAEYILAYYAVLRLGGIIVQVNPMYEKEELEYLLENSGASWFFGMHAQKSKIDALSYKPMLKTVYVGRQEGKEANVYDFYSLLDSVSWPNLPKIDIQPKEDLAVLQYTGGTTGRSKGVMLTHYNLVANVYQSYSFTIQGLKRPGERVLAVSPFFHVYGMTGVLNLGIFRASAVICVPRFQVNNMLATIKKTRPTLFSGVPTMYIALLNHPDASSDALSSLKICISGSAPMPVELMKQFETKTDSPIIEGYGLSECSPVTHRNPLGEHRKPGSIGIPLPNTDAQVVDQHTGEKEMPVGEVGELVIKGPQVMKGYWRNEEETDIALRNEWLFTGDLAVMDEEGYFFIVGRKKDLIIASGYNIYPSEVEEVIYEHPSVKEACVFGVPSSYRGETVKAVIVPKDGMNIDAEEIMEWCSGKIARYKVPKEVSFRKKLPKTTVGKILRRKLMEEEAEKTK